MSFSKNETHPLRRMAGGWVRGQRNTGRKFITIYKTNLGSAEKKVKGDK